MKRALAFALLVVVATSTAFAQTLDLKGQVSRLGGTYLYDPAVRRPVLALTYKTATLTDFLGRKGLNVDLSAIGGASGSGASLGGAALFSWNVRFRLSNEIGGAAALTFGPALLYGTDGGKMRLGAVVGLGFKL